MVKPGAANFFGGELSSIDEVTLPVTFRGRSYGKILAGNLSQQALRLCPVRSEDYDYETTISHLVPRPPFSQSVQLARRGPQQRDASDAQAPDRDALGGIQLCAGEVVVVAIQSASD